MRWTGRALPAGTTLTTGNVNNAGNGDTVTFTTSGTFTAVMASDGVEVVATASSPVVRFDCARTSGLYGVSQLFYTPRENYATSPAVVQFRSASANSGQVWHFSNGKIGVGNAAATGLVSSTVAMVFDHEYLIDFVVVVGGTTSNGRAIFRAMDLTDPTWNTTGDFYYDSGYTVNMGTANLVTHRHGKIGTEIATAGMRFRQIGWNPLSSVDTSLTRSIAESHFMAFPNLDRVNANSLTMNSQAVRQAAIW